MDIAATAHVSDLAIAAMAFSCAMGLVIPIALFIWFRRRGADIVPFFVGCAVMLLFAFVLESGVHQLVFASDAGAAIRSDTWLYALYAGAMAGLFEETGRFLAFKTVLRKRRGNDRNALMYGAGHGGFEAFAVLIAGMAANLVLAMAINAGTMDGLVAGMPSQVAAQLNAASAELAVASPEQFLVAPVERVIAVALHIALSVLVWFAAKRRQLLWLYPVAIVLHAVADALTVVLASTSDLVVIEAAFACVAVAVALFARVVWKRNAQPAV